MSGRTLRGRVLPTTGTVVVSSGLGGVAASSHLAGLAAGILCILVVLPWPALMGALVSAGTVSKWGYDVAGVTLRPDQFVLIPFAARALLSSRQDRDAFRMAEIVLTVWLALQFATSLVNAQNAKLSISAAMVLAAGGVAYAAVATALCTPRRVLLAARFVLLAAMVGAAFGILALVAHFAVGSSVGIDFRYRAHLGSAPAVSGLAWEHDIFGSVSGAAAISFLVLLRDGGHPLFGRRAVLVLGYWTCLVGMLISLSRGAWVGFAITRILISVVTEKRGRARLVRAGASLLLAGAAAGCVLWFTTSGQPPLERGSIGEVGAAVSSSVRTQAAQVLDFGSGTGAGRTREWRVAVDEVWHTSPLIGMGTKSFGQRHFHPSAATFPYLAPSYIESLYVRTFYDSGVIGLLLLLAFLGLVLFPTREVRRARGELGAVARSLILGWVVFAIAFTATDAMFQMWPWIVLGVARAATLAVRRPVVPAVRSRPRPARHGPNGAHPVGPSPRTARAGHALVT